MTRRQERIDPRTSELGHRRWSTDRAGRTIACKEGGEELMNCCKDYHSL